MTQEQKDFLVEQLIATFKRGDRNPQLVAWLMTARVVVFDVQERKYVLVEEE